MVNAINMIEFDCITVPRFFKQIKKIKKIKKAYFSFSSISILPIKKYQGYHMSSRLIFWISNSVRILLVAMGTAAACYMWGTVIGLLLGMLAMASLVLVQLFYLQRLADWLDHPTSSRLPDGWGAWTDIFPDYINYVVVTKKSN